MSSWVATFRVPEHLNDTLSLPDSFKSRPSHWRIHGWRELTSCGVLNAAVTAALAADLSLDSLIGCSHGKLLFVFRQFAS